ncbi:MAG TPA: alpha/beta hydrolase-fold protein [Chitinophaga sp.]
MKQYLLLLVSFSLATACTERPDKNEQAHKTGKENTFQMYSKNVSDSFTITVALPGGYHEQPAQQYPVVYLLDANLYFDIIATTLKKYSEVGLAPSVILVGIGYKDFPAMDSLRNRDDTYPIAIPEYEMSVSGGADKFLSFINTELSPAINKAYKVDTAKRVLMGHSLGGYFTTYAFLQHLTGKAGGFNSYIAASPSIHYNKYWLLNQFKAIPAGKNRDHKINIYITYGGLEDAESQTDTSVLKLADLTGQLSGLLSIKQSDAVHYKADIFSNLDHMDTQFPTFIKGLQWALNEENK